MNGYNFTERTKKALLLAREEAHALRHEYVGTEHILLGLIRESEGVAVAVLTNFQVDLEDLAERIKEIVKQGKATDTQAPDLPYTSRAKKSLELAMTEARELRHTYIGTEHILLGLIREEKGIAAQVLTEAGVTLEGAREETLRLLGPTAPPAEEEIKLAARYVQAKVMELNRAIEKARSYDLRVEYTVNEKTKHLGVNLYSPVTV